MPTSESLLGKPRSEINYATASEADSLGLPNAFDIHFCFSLLKASFYFKTAGSITQEVWPWGTDPIDPKR